MVTSHLQYCKFVLFYRYVSIVLRIYSVISWQWFL